MNDYIKITVIGLTCVMVIILYGTYRCKNTSFVDPLTFAFAPPPLDKYFDGWGLSHLFFFMLLGYMFPKHLLFSFALGVLWELVEYSMKEHPFYLSKCNYDLKTHKGEGWWYGRWQDIVMNGTGLLIGAYLTRRR
jgi:hypothetical protein